MFTVRRFNSIKVRLEPAVNCMVGELLTLFQFHKGTIRTALHPLSLLRVLRCFNSIKVRLEPAGSAGRFTASLFQFHKGTIRTRTFKCKVRRRNMFQFHKGTIRTEVSALLCGFYCLFQFHKGTIRTGCGSLCVVPSVVSIP